MPRYVHRTGRVYRVRSKRHGWRYGVDYKDARGRRIRRIIGTRAEASLALTKILAALLEGTYVAPTHREAPLTMGALRDRHLERGASRGKASLRDDRARWVLIVEHFGEDQLVGALITRDIEAFASWLGKQRSQKRKPFSRSTKNKILAVLRAGLRLAQREGLIDTIPHVGLAPEPEPRDRVASPAEIEALVEAATYPPLRLAIVLAVETGMRRGEICSITWDQVDLEQGQLRLAADQTKTREGRWIILTPRAVEALREAPREGDRVIARCAPTTITSLFRRLCRRLRIEDLNFHDLRHTFATDLRRRGVDLATIKVALGHRRWETTLRYQTVNTEDLRRALSKREGDE